MYSYITDDESCLRELSTNVLVSVDTGLALKEAVDAAKKVLETCNKLSVAGIYIDDGSNTTPSTGTNSNTLYRELKSAAKSKIQGIERFKIIVKLDSTSDDNSITEVGEDDELLFHAQVSKGWNSGLSTSGDDIDIEEGE